MKKERALHRKLARSCSEIGFPVRFPIARSHALRAPYCRIRRGRIDGPETLSLRHLTGCSVFKKSLNFAQFGGESQCNARIT